MSISSYGCSSQDYECVQTLRDRHLPHSLDTFLQWDVTLYSIIGLLHYI